ncbi:MAG: CDP-alcohol phosphatidyltransferase family protein [Candidatus Saccharimonadales bacterium]
MSIEIQEAPETIESPPELHLVEYVPPTDTERHLGVAIEQAANGLTAARAVGGIALAEHIKATPDYQSWRTVGAFVILAATDGEGWLSRLGRKLQRKDESKRRPLNAYGDQLADKILVNGVMLAIAKREKANGHDIYAKTVEEASEITIVRDLAVTADRVVADFQGIDTRAQKGGKRKAAEQYAVIAAALSPIAKNPIARAGIGLAFLHTIKSAVESGISLHASFRERRKARKLARKVVACTTQERSVDIPLSFPQ